VTGSPQLSLPFSLPLADRLELLGLHGVRRVVLHTNRTVMLSLAPGGVLRIHQGYAFAPDSVLRAIARFLDARLSRAARRAAERELLAFPVEEYAPAPARVRPERPKPGDLLVLHRLETRHRELNQLHFGGTLGPIPFRISGRMRTRLGELSVDRRTGRPIEIALSRRHVERHPWTEVEHTLLHEMVHQWQAEGGLPVDHGAIFREEARRVGILASSTRPRLLTMSSGDRKPR
jgi:hypothetical protein